jgi:ribonuclease T2
MTTVALVVHDSKAGLSLFGGDGEVVTHHHHHHEHGGKNVGGGEGHKGATPGDFDLFVYAQSWMGSFCSGRNCQKEECTALPGTYGENHLTTHGLWPQYAPNRGNYLYPMFCGSFSQCDTGSPPSSCLPDTKNVDTADFEKYAPGYIDDDHFLANHEWPKHGSCTKISQPEFFSAVISAAKELAAGASTAIDGHVGQTVSMSDVNAAYGGATWVSLSCQNGTHGKELSQVLTCWSKGADGLPSQRIECPENSRSTSCGDADIYIPASLSLIVHIWRVWCGTVVLGMMTARWGDIGIANRI